MIKAPQSLQVLCCSAALAVRTSVLYFLYCNLTLLFVHLRQNTGVGKKSTTTLFMLIFYIFENCNLHYLQIFLLWTMQSQFFQFFLCLYFLGHLCLFILGSLHLSSAYMCMQHSIPVKWNNYASCLTLKTSHLGVLTWWLLFSHQYRIYFSLWCIINTLTCFFSRTDAYIFILYPATDCS